MYQNFIEEYIYLLDDYNYEEFYRQATDYFLKHYTTVANIGMDTSVFQEAGIDPLDYMDIIPEDYFIEHSFPGYYKVPKNIKKIKNGAFEFTEGLEEVYCPEGLLEIEMLAFHECEDLLDIYLPNSLKLIAPGTLSPQRRKGLTIHAPAGSYAEEYAKKYNFKYDNNGNAIDFNYVDGDWNIQVLRGASDGGVYAVGDFIIFKMNSDFEEEWSQLYEGDVFAIDIVETHCSFIHLSLTFCHP